MLEIPGMRASDSTSTVTVNSSTREDQDDPCHSCCQLFYTLIITDTTDEEPRQFHPYITVSHATTSIA